MQPEGPPPNVASSSSGGNPVKLEPAAVDSNGDWYQSDGDTGAHLADSAVARMTQFPEVHGDD